MSVEMVKLTDTFDQGGAVGEHVSSSRTTPRSHHNWGARLGRRRDEAFTESKGLQELEELTRRTVNLMEKHSPKCEQNYERAMDLLRLQYNMVSKNNILNSRHCSFHFFRLEITIP